MQACKIARESATARSTPIRAARAPTRRRWSVRAGISATRCVACHGKQSGPMQRATANKQLATHAACNSQSAACRSRATTLGNVGEFRATVSLALHRCAALTAVLRCTQGRECSMQRNLQRLWLQIPTSLVHVGFDDVYQGMITVFQVAPDALLSTVVPCTVQPRPLLR